MTVEQGVVTHERALTIHDRLTAHGRAPGRKTSWTSWNLIDARTPMRPTCLTPQGPPSQAMDVWDRVHGGAQGRMITYAGLTDPSLTACNTAV
jgi:hypothetical protein